MSTKLLLVTLSSILLLTQLAGCERPIDPDRTLADVTILVDRLNSHSPTGAWSDIDLLRGISHDTLVFLSQDFSAEDVKALETVSPEMAKMLLASSDPTKNNCSSCASQNARRGAAVLMKFKSMLHPPGHFYPAAGLRLKDSIPDLKEGVLPDWLAAVAAAKWQQLKKEHRKIFGSLALENETFCEGECTCIANHLGSAIKAADPKRTVLYLSMGGGCMRGGVCPWPDAKPIKPKDIVTSWTSHTVFMVDDDKGGWTIVDPLVFGDTKGHSPREWYAQFQHKTPATYFVSPRAKTLGRDYIATEAK